MRVSFLGGTTDFPEFFKTSQTPGRVIGTTIDKYVFVSIIEQPSFETIKFRFSWRFTESVTDVGDISHPVLRKVLEKEHWEKPLNISTMASLPGRSGLGSSSAFTVGLISAIHAVRKNYHFSHRDLALEAIRVERDELNEAGGWQDQIQCAIGGFRKYTFSANGIDFSDPIGNSALKNQITDSLVLIATGGGRDSHVHAQKTKSNVNDPVITDYLVELSNLTESVFQRMQAASSAEEQVEILADGMNGGWRLKTQISKPSNENVDDLIAAGMRRGALAGKLCGAGGSGFAAFLVNPKKVESFLSNFPSNRIIRVRATETGNEIIRL